MKRTDDIKLAAPCGEYCGICPHYEKECEGCSIHKGHPSWGECKLYTCVSKRGIEHCGLCADFPCDFQIGYFDPDNPEGQRNAVVRTGLLAYRKKHGNRKWLDLVKKTPKARHEKATKLSEDQ